MNQDTDNHQFSESSDTATSIDTSERDRHQNAVTKLEKRLQRALDAGRIFSWEINPETRTIEWSDNVEIIVGFPLPGDIDGGLALVHPADAQATLDAINEALEAGGEYESEYRLINPATGEACWFHSQGAMVVDALDGTSRFSGITQNITTRKRAEEALRESEAKFRALYASIDEGFYLAEVIRDEAGKMIDIFYLEENPAAIKMIGQTAKNRLWSEIYPDYEQYWLDIFDHTARTGEAKRIESYTKPIDMWLTTYIFKPEGYADDRTFALIYKDITDRKRAEANRAFLAEIADDLSRLSTAEEIMETVGAKTGAYLGVSSVVFVDVDDERGEVTVADGWTAADVPDLRGQTLRLSDYYTSEEFFRARRAGEVFVLGDVRLDPRTAGKDYSRLEINAFVTVPFHRNGVWKNYLGVTGAAPRDWRADEIELFTELSNRLFRGSNAPAPKPPCGEAKSGCGSPSKPPNWAPGIGISKPTK